MQQQHNRGRDSHAGQQGHGAVRQRSHSRSRVVTTQGPGKAQTSILNTQVQLGAGRPIDIQVKSTTWQVQTITKRVLHITFLIDASFSMADPTMHGGRCKLDVVLDNVQRMVGDVLKPDDRITVLMFHKVPEQLCYNMPVFKLHMAEVRKKAHETMQRSQGTSLYYSAVKALDIMKSIADSTPDVTVLDNGDKEVVLRKLVVFTDGQDNTSRDQVYEDKGHGQKIICTMDTVLQRLALPGMGAFHFTLIAVGNHQELRDALALRTLLERQKLSHTCSVITELGDINRAFNVVRTKIKQIVLENLSIDAQHNKKGPVMGSLVNGFIKQQADASGHKLLAAPPGTQAGAASRPESRGRARRGSRCGNH